MFDDIWDFIADGFDYLIHFEWVGDSIDGIVDFFSGAGDAFTSDSPVFNVWFWVFFILFATGMWILPSAIGITDYSLRDKLLGSAIFLVIDFFIVNHFRDS